MEVFFMEKNVLCSLLFGNVKVYDKAKDMLIHNHKNVASKWNVDYHLGFNEIQDSTKSKLLSKLLLIEELFQKYDRVLFVDFDTIINDFESPFDSYQENSFRAYWKPLAIDKSLDEKLIRQHLIKQMRLAYLYEKNTGKVINTNKLIHPIGGFYMLDSNVFKHYDLSILDHNPVFTKDYNEGTRGFTDEQFWTLYVELNNIQKTSFDLTYDFFGDTKGDYDIRHFYNKKRLEELADEFFSR
jgi:hypothetical protein